MARGRKTGGRQKGTPNKRIAQLEARVAEAGARATEGLSSSQIVAMTPLEVLLQSMRLEAESGHWRMAASIAEKAAPYMHAKLAPRVDKENEGAEVTIKITGGLPDVAA